MIRHADPVLMNVFRMLHGYSPDPDCPNDTVGADIVCSWDGRRFCGDEKKTELALAALSIIATDPDTMQLTTLRLGCTLNATGMLVRERFREMHPEIGAEPVTDTVMIGFLGSFRECETARLAAATPAPLLM